MIWLYKSKVTSLSELRSDLQNLFQIADDNASRELSKLRSNAEKKIRDVNRRLDNLGEASTEFEETITEDTNVMDKYSQNIYDKIQETIENIEQPSNISLRTLESYLNSIRQGLAEQDKILVKYIKLLKDRKYKGRVRSLDKSLMRLLKDLKGLEDFVKSDYAPSASVETTSITIEETMSLLDDFESNFQNLQSHEQEVLSKKVEVNRLGEELESLKSHPTLNMYQESKNSV